MRTYPRSGFRSGGTSECTLVPVFVSVEHVPKAPFLKTTLLRTPDLQRDRLQRQALSAIPLLLGLCLWIAIGDTTGT